MSAKIHPQSAVPNTTRRRLADRVELLNWPPTQPTKMVGEWLLAAGRQLGIAEANIDLSQIERPAEAQYGDFAVTAPLRLWPALAESQPELVAKHGWQQPRQLAQALVDHWPADERLAKVSVAGPGFINLTLTRQFWAQFLGEMLQPNQPDKPHSQPGKVLLEYMQPNTNKPLHIGHLRNATLGVALAYLLERQGHEFIRATINNDRGLHIIKSLWSYLTFGRSAALTGSAELTAEIQEKAGQATTAVLDELLHQWQQNPADWQQPAQMTEKRLKKPDHFVGHWYVLADQYAQNEAVQAVWQYLLQAWEQRDHAQHQVVRSLWRQLNTWFYEGYQQSADRLDVWFDPEHVSYESEIYEAGRQIVVEAADQGIFKRLPDGAVQAVLEPELPNKILLRRDGTGIYMTFDIELTRQRAALALDQLIWLVGNDQALYFQQLFAIAQKLGFGARSKFRHFSYGMVRLPEGTMSSRAGRIVHGDDVLDSAVARAKEVIGTVTRSKSLTPAQQDQVAEAVGVGAVKWALLAQDPMSEMTFDLQQSVSLTGFAGPFVQYALARCASILTECQLSVSLSHYEIFKHIAVSFDAEIDPAEHDLLIMLTQYYEVLSKSATEFAPHVLCRYLYNLARILGNFYTNCPVKTATGPTRERRLSLVLATALVLKEGLTILGIEPIEQM